MSVKPRHLGADEQVVRALHTHAKVLLAPAAALLLLAVVLGAGLAMMPLRAQPWGSWALVAAVLVGLLATVVVPVLRWRSETWTLTTRRIIHRRGILTRTAHDLPLSRISDVESERGVLDRVLGCGTLRLMTAAEDPVLMVDVPDVEEVHVQLSELLFGAPEVPGGRDD